MDGQTLRFTTNGAEFDFPDYDGRPEHAYLLASTPRCGSNFLQRALWRSGLAGAPEEYLTPEYVGDFNRRWGTRFDRPLGPDQVPQFMERLWRIRTSPNGGFGLKLHGSHLRYATDEAGVLLAPFQGAKWIWIRRKNRIAQAISYLMADQTGVWIVDGEWLPISERHAEPKYDRDGISVRLDQIEREEGEWAAYFEKFSLTPHVVEYETLMELYEDSVGEVLSFLGVPAPHHVEDSGIRRQATELNVEWESQYRSGT